MKIMLVGAGNAADVIISETQTWIETFYIYDIDSNKSAKLSSKYVNAQIAELDDLDKVDVVIEAASPQAVKEIYKQVINQGKDFIILSSGAFSDKTIREDFSQMLKTSKSKVAVPSGAIGGLDLIAAVKNSIKQIEITTTKSPKSLNLENLEEPKVIFQGSSVEAIEKFPKNINVAVTLSLAVEDFDKVAVKIVADPKVDSNTHSIHVDSTIGDYKFEIKNNKSNNPGTSLLAPLSVVGLLRNYNSQIKIGI